MLSPTKFNTHCVGISLNCILSKGIHRSIVFGNFVEVLNVENEISKSFVKKSEKILSLKLFEIEI
jgi:hypothetical protein